MLGKNNKLKKDYEQPLIEVIVVSNEDVVTSSTVIPIDNDPNKGVWDI